MSRGTRAYRRGSCGAEQHAGSGSGRRLWRSAFGGKSLRDFRSGERPGGTLPQVAASTAGWFTPRRWAAVGAIAAVVIVAFLAGRVTKRTTPEPTGADVSAGNVRERVLIMAVGEHLGRSEMVLVDLANAEPLDAKQKQVNISAEQRRAEDLLEENRLYRQTASGTRRYGTCQYPG